MEKRPVGQGYSVPGRELSDAVQRAAKQCGLNVEKKEESSSPLGMPGEPKTYDVLNLSYKNGEKNWLGFQKTYKAKLCIDPQENYSSLTAVNIKSNGEYNPCQMIYSKLEEMQKERFSGYKK